MLDGTRSRVVTVSSSAHRSGRLDLDDLRGERAYSGSRACSRSKLANVMSSYEPAGRTETTTRTANALHPGVASTAFGAEDPGLVQRALVPLIRPFLKSPARGAATSIRLASDPALRQASGCCFANGRPAEASAASHDQTAATRLWRESVDLVGLATTV